MQTPSTIRALRLPRVLEKTGISRTHAYRLMAKDDFPKPHKLSERISVWDECEIDNWLASKMGVSYAK